MQLEAIDLITPRRCQRRRLVPADDRYVDEPCRLPAPYRAKLSKMWLCEFCLYDGVEPDPVEGFDAPEVDDRPADWELVYG